MSQKDIENDRETRFNHLLQPIRDLAETWNIDVARELEDYLEELESLTLSLDGGRTNLNFAEAALLIQGSTCIYSKKVENLYSLIYKTLDTLSSRRVVGRKKRENLDESDAFLEAKEEFLLLDDVLEESNDVDLHEDASILHNISVAAALDATKTPRAYGTHQNLASKTPLSIMATLGKRSSHNTTAFRFAGTTVHPSGALLLDPSHGTLLDGETMQRPTRLSTSSSVAAITTGNLFADRRVSMSDATFMSAAEIAAEAGPGFEDYGDDDDGHYDMGGVDTYDDEHIPTNAPTDGDMQSKQDAEIGQHTMEDISHIHDSNDSAHDNEISHPFKSVRHRQKEITQASIMTEPWAQLDMYDGSATRNKPAKRGKTWSAPIDAAKMARFGPAYMELREKAVSRIVQRFKTLSANGNHEISEQPRSDTHILENLSHACNANVRKMTQELPDSTIWKCAEISNAQITRTSSIYAMIGGDKGVTGSDVATHGLRTDVTKNFATLKPHFVDIQSAYDAYQKRVAGVRLHKRFHQPANMSNMLDGPSFAFSEEGDEIDDHIDGMPALDDNDDDDQLPDTDVFDNFADDEPLALVNEPITDSENILKTMTEKNGSMISYEELVRDHIKSYMENADKAVRDTDLSKTVNSWRDKVQPLLELETEREDFDIYRCGDNIVETLSNLTDTTSTQNSSSKSTINFTQITDGTQRYEVCRMFLATLQLANEGVVEFEHDQLDVDDTTSQTSDPAQDQGPGDASVCCNLSVVLKTTTRPYTAFDGYRAPSIREDDVIEQNSTKSTTTTSNENASDTKTRQVRRKKRTTDAENQVPKPKQTRLSRRKTSQQTKNPSVETTEEIL